MTEPSAEVYFFGLTLGAAAVILCLNPGDVCLSEMVGKAIADKTASSCFEFWLNRYQSLIGAAVTLLAAITAWLSVTKQINVQRAQSKRAEAVSSLRLMLSILTLVSLIRQLDPENIKNLFVKAVSGKDPTRYVLTGTRARVSEARRGFDAYMGEWHAFYANDAVKLKLNPFNYAIQIYMSELCAVLDGAEVIIGVMPGNNLSVDVQAPYVTFFESLTAPVIKPWRILVKNMTLAIQDANEFLPSQLTGLHQDEINAIVQRFNDTLDTGP